MFKDSVLKTYENKPGLWWNLMSSSTAKAAKLPLDFRFFKSSPNSFHSLSPCSNVNESLNLFSIS